MQGIDLFYIWHLVQTVKHVYNSQGYRVKAQNVVISMAQSLQMMFILPVASDHLSKATTVACGRSRQVIDVPVPWIPTFSAK